MTTVAFDADDTLWHNEREFAETEQRFRDLLAPWGDPDTIDATLIAHERARLTTWGYGVKSFALSMLNAAIELTNGDTPTHIVSSIIGWADELLAAPTVLIDGAIETVMSVAETHRVLIITKGDLHHQMRRIGTTTLASICEDIEVVSEKDTPTYQKLLRRHTIDPGEFVMIGNSVASDIRPVLDAGARAIHIPYEVTWALEVAKDPAADGRWWRLSSITEVPALIDSLSVNTSASTQKEAS